MKNFDNLKEGGSLKTPVALIIFNRPETTKKVFEAIRAARPSTLLIVADGARADIPGEVEKCERARRIIDEVDWDCEVLKNYSDHNMDCRARVSSGLNWVFDMVHEAIILEDDCLPHPTFFRFCEQMLDLYRDDERIMHISGNNFQNGIKRGESSYYYSKYSHVWGWASWRRAWRFYDVEMQSFPQFVQQAQIKNIFHDKGAQKYWLKTLRSVFACEIDTWDCQWNYAMWMQNGLSILPNVNLVSNIGFGAGATHTSDCNILSNLPFCEMSFPLTHPSNMICDNQADLFTERPYFRCQTLWQRIVSKGVRFIRSKNDAV